jgi:hypothetical protein
MKTHGRLETKFCAFIILTSVGCVVSSKPKTPLLGKETEAVEPEIVSVREQFLPLPGIEPHFSALFY